MNRSFRILFLTLSISLFFVPSEYAQTNPNLENGFTPYGSLDQSNFDTVDMGTGNLTIHIPLFNYPQRGPLPSGYAILVNTKNFYVLQTCNPKTQICTDRWNIISSTSRGAQIVHIGLPWVVYKYKSGLHNITAMTWDGGSHQMSGAESLDATGIWINNQVPPTSIADNHGNTFTTTQTNGSTSQDTNGNYIFFPPGNTNYTYMDTMGRTDQSNSTTSDFTGCGGPTGQLTSASVNTYRGPNNIDYQVKTCFTSVTVATNFKAFNIDYPGPQTIPEYGPSVGGFIQSIVVYDGNSWSTSPAWTFAYNDHDPGDPSNINYGNVTQVILPTGGTISYTYRTVALCGEDTLVTTASRAVNSRTENANDGQGNHTTTYVRTNPAIGNPMTVTVTDPLGNYAVRTFTGLASSCSYYETKAQYYQNGGTLLKTVQTDYTYVSPNPYDSWNDGAVTVLSAVPIRVTTTLDNGQVSKVETDWDQKLGNYSYGNVLEQRDFDYGSGAPGPLLRRTDYTYLAFNNSNYLALNMLDRKASVTVYNGSGVQLSQTIYGYDESSPVSSGISTQHASLPSGTPRGNQTSAKKWLNTTGGTLNTTTTYYDTGMPYQITDPRGNTTTFAYSSSYFGAYVTQTTMPQTGSVQHIVSGTYDFNTGKVASFTDQNSQVTNYIYDQLARMTSASFPDGGLTSFSYPNLTTIQRQTKITSSLTKTETTLFDGLGRKIQTELLTDPDGPTYTATTYDALGRVSQQYNPTRCSTPTTNCGESIWGYTTTGYDAVGRVISVIAQDNGSTTTSTYAGNCVTVTDPAGISRQSCSDGLGRLTQVTEDPGSSPHLNYVINYTYDALDNLLTVVQNGSHSRSFSYDSLSRLLCASNPENSTAACPNPASGTYTTGTAGYSYDPNGNVSTRIAPAPNPNPASPTVTTTYSYDALNRLTGKIYSDTNTPAPTPSVSLSYDQSASWGPIANPIGHLTTTYVGANNTPTVAGTEYSYDAMGRPVLYAQCMPSNCGTNSFNTNYTYDLAGDMTSASDGFGVTISYTYDTAGRPSQVTSSLVDTQHPNTLATMDATAGYLPNGAIHKMTLANGVTQSSAYSNRLQPCRIGFNTSGGVYATTSSACTSTAPANSILDFTYCYGLAYQSSCSGTSSTTANSGNISNWNAVGGQTFSRSYSYDSLNRLLKLSSPSESCQGFNWTYDAWGNMYDESGTAGNCFNYHGLTPNAKNQLVGTSGTTYQYDAAGNMTYDGSHHYFYDAENRLIQLDGTLGTRSTATMCYVYDANGMRVRSSAPNGGSEWIHDIQGNLVGQNILGFGFGRGFVYLGSQEIAEYGDGTTYFIHPDQLGSTRLMTKLDHSTCWSTDYLPFGQQINSTGSCGTSHDFTGKEFDLETSFSYFGARYDDSMIGRFMTPDPLMASAHAGDPQSWNRYTYALNNPLRFVDPNGMDPGCGSGDDSKCKVTIKVNVIYDKNANNGKGLTDQQKKDFQNKTLGKAITDFGKSGIGLQVTYTAGSLTVDDGKASVTGTQSNSLNLLVTDTLPTGNAGDSAFSSQSGYISLIGANDAHNSNIFPLFTNTVEHEFTHQLKGDTQNPNTNAIGYVLNEFNVDFRVQMMGWGVRQDALVSGAQNRPFTVQPKQENIKPRTDQ